MENVKIYIAHGYDREKSRGRINSYIKGNCFVNLCCSDEALILNNEFISCGTGDNIIDRYLQFRELTALYWIWKNIRHTGLIGFFLDDKYLSFQQQNTGESVVKAYYLDEGTIAQHGLDAQVIQKNLLQDNLVIPQMLAVSDINPNYEFLAHFVKYNEFEFNDNDTVALRSAISKKTPEMLPYFSAVMDSRYILPSQCFVMGAEYFDQYCGWLFDILFEIESKIDTSRYTLLKKYEFARYGRILLATFALYRESISHESVIYNPVLFIEDVSADIVPSPAFELNNVPIIFNCSNYYVPYFACALSSIIENSSSAYNYDLIVLESNISDRNKRVLSDMLKLRENFSMRFYNPVRHLCRYQEEISKTTGYRFVMEVYYRIIALYLFKTYDKLIWLDSDIIVLNDIGKLFDFSLNGKIAAFARDLMGFGYAGASDKNYRDYYNNEFPIQDFYNYFNAGVGIIDCVKFRTNIEFENFLLHANNENYKIKDQDVLNLLLENNVAYFPNTWNYVSLGVETTEPFFVSLDGEREYLSARESPNIIHYAGSNKPWDANTSLDKSEHFWEYARKTPFYEEIYNRAFLGIARIENDDGIERASAEFFIRLYKALKKTFPVHSKRYKLIRKLLGI